MRYFVLSGLVGLLLCVSACDENGAGGKGGKGRKVFLDDAHASCDPNESSWDDYFEFEAETSGPVNSVNVVVWNGSSKKGTMRLNEAASGNWYVDVWGDDISSDCDDWQYMSFDFNAQGDDDSDSIQVRP